jgi:YgiT-type zinc finger domain-containing protein
VTDRSDFCEYCDGPLDDGERLVTVFRHRKGRHFIFERVPARVCRRCGERYFSAATAHDMERRMRRRNARAATVVVPVIPIRATS